MSCSTRHRTVDSCQCVRRGQLPLGSAAVVGQGLHERPVGVLQLGLRAIDLRPVPCRREELGDLPAAEVARAERSRHSSGEQVED